MTDEARVKFQKQKRKEFEDRQVEKRMKKELKRWNKMDKEEERKRKTEDHEPSQAEHPMTGGSSGSGREEKRSKVEEVVDKVLHLSKDTQHVHKSLSLSRF